MELKKKRLFFPGSVVFKLHATDGLPVVDTLAHLRAKSIKVDWYSFVEAAIAGGWLGDRIVTVVESALRDLGVDESEMDCVVYRLKLSVVRALNGCEHRHWGCECQKS